MPRVKRYRAQFKPTDGFLRDRLSGSGVTGFIGEALRQFVSHWQGVSDQEAISIRVTLDPVKDGEIIAMLDEVSNTRDVSRVIRAACYYYMGRLAQVDPREVAEALRRLGVGEAPLTENEEREVDRWLSGDLF